MSEPLPPVPLQAPSRLLNYVSTSNYGRAPTLVKLAAIFNIVLGSLGLLFGAIEIGLILWVYVMATRAAAAMAAVPSATRPATMRSPPETLQTAVVFGLLGLFSCLCGVVELTAGIKFLRRTAHGFGWGIAAVVAAFISVVGYIFPCCVLGVLPVGVAIFTLVVLCLEMPRRYLRNQPGQERV